MQYFHFSRAEMLAYWIFICVFNRLYRCSLFFFQSQPLKILYRILLRHTSINCKKNLPFEHPHSFHFFCTSLLSLLGLFPPLPLKTLLLLLHFHWRVRLRNFSLPSHSFLNCSKRCWTQFQVKKHDSQKPSGSRYIFSKVRRAFNLSTILSYLFEIFMITCENTRIENHKNYTLMKIF